MRPNQSLPLLFRNSQLFNIIQFTESKISWLEEETSSCQCLADKLLAPITVLHKTERLLNTPDPVFKWFPASPPITYSQDPAFPWLCHRVDIAPSSFFPSAAMHSTHSPLAERFSHWQVFAVQVPLLRCYTDSSAWTCSGHTQALDEVSTPHPLIFPQFCSRNVSLARGSTQSSPAVSAHLLPQQKHHGEKAVLPWLEVSQEKRICS